MYSTPSVIIFDLDGTLVDSAPDLHACANRLLTTHGHSQISLDQSKKFIGDGIRHFIKCVWSAVGRHLDERELDLKEKEFLSYYEKFPAVLTQLYPGVDIVLGELQQRGYRMGICTNKPQIATERLLSELGISHFFDKVAGGDLYPERKPNKFHLLNLLEEMDTLPNTAIMVGDNEHDSETARAAQVYFVFSTYGYSRLSHDQITFNSKVDTFYQLLELDELKVEKTS